MRKYKLSDKFLNLTEEEVENDVELFYIDLVDELGLEDVSNMFEEEIHMLYFTRHLESDDE